MKYVLISGGVVSGLGKGITASSIGLLLKESGLNVTAIKIDPYLNIDAGTMSPYEHGEVYVLDDGGEADLDLGNYERFLNVNLTRDHNITSGKVFQRVTTAERRGDYLGKTVQIVPHLTDCIQEWISRVSIIPVNETNEVPDVCVIELGGTVGDIESSFFLEALRQFKFKVGQDNFCHVHVSLITIVGAVGEQKTKPTQHSCQTLRSAGFLPDILVCRCSEPVIRSVREKLALFSMVPFNRVLSIHDVNNVYEVPSLLLRQNVVSLVLNQIHSTAMPVESIPHWDLLATKVQRLTKRVKIAMVGKYTGLTDSYLSVIKALQAASLHCDRKLEIVWIASTDLQKSTESEKRKAAWEKLKEVDGVLIPGGFGDRGVEGKVLAAKFCRENKVPYLGICLGMQVAVIEYARHVCKWKKANSTEFDADTKHPVVIFMPEIDQHVKGGNMRLGSRCTKVKEGSLSHLLYGKLDVLERHRHRYEVNPQVIDDMTKAGLIFSGQDEVGNRMETIELPPTVHPFYYGTQFHPEFKSRPLQISPPFRGLIEASCGLLQRDRLPGSPTFSALSQESLPGNTRKRRISDLDLQTSKKAKLADGTEE